MTNYIYFVYGDRDEAFMEAAYSIGTLARRLKDTPSQIIVFTDQPDKVKDWPVICESVAGQLEAMRGKTGFVHRAKLRVMQCLFEKYPGHMIFLDSDTFVGGDMAKLAGRLSPGQAIMHAFESRNPEIGLAGFHTTLAGNISYHFGADSQMYNSGVFGLHRDDRAVVDLALELCDALLDFGSRIHTAEQFAISEALRISHIKLLEARHVVTHYMGHRRYMLEKIREETDRSGRPPWAFQRQVPYSYLKVYWLKKFGYYLNESQRVHLFAQRPAARLSVHRVHPLPTAARR